HWIYQPYRIWRGACSRNGRARYLTQVSSSVRRQPMEGRVLVPTILPKADIAGMMPNFSAAKAKQKANN
ncbi:MAG: hypothetical protein OEW68_07590, partial [Gammaproteobacteria bacterium]|nr:hypothetical protein [Gammaproteobacteria bacterium]